MSFVPASPLSFLFSSFLKLTFFPLVIQMPIVDGLTSTKMIRAFEKSTRHGTGQQLSAIASDHGRVPIFAVSASLVEHEKDTYVDAGFDGWILKPIDFKRLETLLQGITDDKVRNESLYVPGQWERGGWFGRKGMGHMGQEQQMFQLKEHREREQRREEMELELKEQEELGKEKETVATDGAGAGAGGQTQTQPEPERKPEPQPEPPKRSMLDV